MAAPGPRRIGLFGGAFDPPHAAHLALAQAAMEQLGLDELRILPTGQAWHKARALSPAPHRLAMARLAFKGQPRAVVDDRELRRAGPSYTVDTLRELQAEQPGAQWFLVIGADQAQGFGQWREPEAIARLATICVAGRPSEDGLSAAPAGDSPAGSAEGGYPIPAAWQPLAMSLMPLSATRIREALARGETAEGLVPNSVARYIAQHHLYPPTR